MPNYSIWPIYRILFGSTTSGQSGSGSNGNEGVLHILQSSSVTGASQSDFYVSYPGHLLEREVLPLCRDAIGVSYSLSWQSQGTLGITLHDVWAKGLQVL